MEILNVLETMLALFLVVSISCITYPIYIMTDRSRPVLKLDYGLTSTATMGLYATSCYALLVLIGKFKLIFPRYLEVPLLSIIATLTFYGCCDIFNAIRFQNRQHDNEDKFGDVKKPNQRANTVAAFYFFQTVSIFFLLLIALHRAPPAPKPKKSDDDSPTAEEVVTLPEATKNPATASPKNPDSSAFHESFHETSPDDLA